MKKYFSVLVILLFISGLCASAALAQGGLPGTGGQPPPPGAGGGLDIKPPSQFENIGDLAKAISGFIFNISLPIGFGLIIYAGIRFLTARGDPAQVSAAKNILKYVVIGLAIVFINQGFVTLITDILGTNTPAP